MPQTTYTYSISNDFPNQAVDLTTLEIEINANSVISADRTLDGLNTDGDDCNIVIDDALSVDQKTELDTIVGNHQGVALLDTPQRANSLAEQTNSTSTWEDALTLSPGALKGGNWQVTWYCEIKVQTQDNNSGIFARLTLNSTERTFSSSASDQYQSFSGSGLLTFNDGDTPVLDLQFRRVGTSNDALIRRCQIAIVREDVDG